MPKEELIRLELFTVAELKNWLFHNITVRGLSDRLISKTRALAIVNNPFVNDGMNVVSAIFVGDDVAAYTAVFPDKLARPDRLVYWNTTLYVAPEYEGRGFGAIVMGQMSELYENNYFDHAAAAASIQNFRFLGLPVSFVTQYLLVQKAFANSLKGNLFKFFWRCKNWFGASKTRDYYRKLTHLDYHVEYVGAVDDDVYGFIEKHSEGDVFLRSKEMFNWMLRYSFDIEAPLIYRVRTENAFSAFVREGAMFACKVIDDEKVVGFYILKKAVNMLTIKYLYFDPSSKDLVFSSVFEHIYTFGVDTACTYNRELADYLFSTRYFHHKTQSGVSFTHPEGFVFDSQKTLQAGDGDMFS